MDDGGYIYILSNPAMPNIVKIGKSKHGGRQRAKELYSQGGTGVPMPFDMEFEIWADDRHESECSIHEEMRANRINESREFFSIEVPAAIEIVMRSVGGNHNLSVGHADFSVMEDDILPSYGFASAELIKANFPGMPHGLILASAISNHLSGDAIAAAIIRYKGSCDKRGSRRKESGGDIHALL